MDLKKNLKTLNINTLSILIPVYNEKRTIEALLHKVLQVPLPLEKEIIIIDGCSEDGTREILEKLKEQYPFLKIIYERKREGRGAALKKGIRQSTGDIVLFQDADLELDPHDYPKLIREFSNPDVSAVFGSRFLVNRPPMTFLQLAGNTILTKMVNVLYGSRLTDVETCYQMFKKDAIKDISLHSNDFAFTVELTIRLLISGIHIKEVPITYYPRGRKEGKKIYWKDGLISLWIILKLKILD